MTTTGFEPKYMTLQDIVKQISTYRGRRPRKVAISITGGGANGAYEAGAVEAIMEEFSNPNLVGQKPLRPDILAGTSIGAIISSSLFVDLLYWMPPPAGTASSIYKSHQSITWREVFDGNRGSEKVAGDRAVIIQYIDQSRPLPIVGDIAQAIKNLEKASHGLVEDFGGFRDKLDAFSKELSSFDADIASIGLQNTRSTLDQDFGKLRKDTGNIKGKITTLSKGMPPFTDIVEIKSLVNSILQFIADLLAAIGDTAGALWKDLTNDIDILVSAVRRHLANIARDLVDIVTSFGVLFWDGAKVAGNFLALMKAIGVALATLGIVLEFAGYILLVAGGVASITSHLIENKFLLNIIKGYGQRAFGNDSARRRPASAGTNSVIIDDWISRLNNGEKVPELFLVGTDMTQGAARSVVFSIAKEETMTEMDDKALWTVDLAKQHNLTRNIFHPMFGDGDVDTLAKATMTSASFPIAFEPMSWRIQREINNAPQEFRHKFLDGGITNNSPVDVAAYAGATHLISLELSPLLSDIVLTDNRGYNVFNIYTGLFDTAAYSHLVRNISTLASENRDRPNRNKMQIYRLAPLLPREDANGNKISPTTLDFDGVYDGTSTLRRSIYDWFMQGYLDAMGPSASRSLVFKDYTDASLDRGYMKNADLSFKNKFWRASIQAYPDTPPP